MYGQTLALAALSAMGVAAVPQMCACPPNSLPAGAPGAPGAGAANTPFPFGPGPTAGAGTGTGAPFPYSATSTSTVTLTSTDYITSTMMATSGAATAPGTGAGGSPSTVTSTLTSTETETITQTITHTQAATVVPTNTVQPPPASGSSSFPSAPHYPYPGPSTNSYPTGTGTGYGTGTGATGATAPGAGSTSSRHHFSYPHHTHSSRSRSGFPGTAGTAPGTSAPGTTAPTYSVPTIPGTSLPATTTPTTTPYQPQPYPTGGSSDSSTSVSSVYQSSSSAGGAAPTSTGQFPQNGITVTKDECFNNGAGNSSVSDVSGVAAETSYQCFSGPASNFPSSDKWISFEAMKTLHTKLGQTYCSNNVFNTDAQVQMVFNAIDAVGAASKVDKRVILAQMLQESSGCVNVPSTNNGVENNGLMQSHDGAKFVGNNASAEDQYNSVLNMVSDGVQGTYYVGANGGDGMVQTLNANGDYFTAARIYNSGSVDPSDLSNAHGATAWYCSDSANFLMGWDGVIAGRTNAQCKW